MVTIIVQMTSSNAIKLNTNTLETNENWLNKYKFEQKTLNWTKFDNEFDSFEK